jgi:HAD superfamily hydrolase (TIGR01490 family)
VVEAAFFDLDKTVIARASIMAFSRPLHRGGLLKRTSMARGAWSQLAYLTVGADEQRLVRIREAVLGATAGWDRMRVRELIEASLDAVIGPIVFAEARELIGRHRQAGRLLYLVSAAPSDLVEPLAEYLGMQGAIASIPEIDDAGRYTGRMAFYASGPAKAHAVRDLARLEDIDLSASFAYSDSATDIPMLDAVGHPVAVNPDRALRKAALERQWEILNFKDPTWLRHASPGLRTKLVSVALISGALCWVALAGRSRSRLTGPGLVTSDPRGR